MLKKFKEVCPRQLSELPCESCPLALERINAIKSDNSDKRKRDLEPSVGCPWFVASAEHNYCFWLYNKFLDNEPVTDRETCDLLLISKQLMEKTFESAIDKLRELKDTSAIKDLAESVLDIAEQSNIDYTSYMPSEFREAIAKSDAEEIKVEDASKSKDKPKTRIKHPTGLPLHRDGKKVDLFGLYSRKIVAPKREDKKDESNKKDNKK